MRPRCVRLSAWNLLLLVCGFKNRLGKPSSERFVTLELLEQLGIGFEHRGKHSFKRFIVFNFCVFPVGILPRVLKGGVLKHFLRNLALDSCQCSLRVGVAARVTLVELVDIGKARGR